MMCTELNENVIDVPIVCVSSQVQELFGPVPRARPIRNSIKRATLQWFAKKNKTTHSCYLL